MLPEFLDRHPLAPEAHAQGFLACLYELQEMLKDVTGMHGVSLTPMAGAQGEFAGVAMIRAYHLARGDTARNADHRARCGARHQPRDGNDVRLHVGEIPTRPDGDVDMDALAGCRPSYGRPDADQSVHSGGL